MKLTENDIRITAAVCHKSAVELVAKTTTPLDDEEITVVRVDKLTRKLLNKHLALLNELMVE